MLPEVVKEADKYLDELNDISSKERLEDTKRIIEGFETPYGLELLATTDWIIKHYPRRPIRCNSTVEHFRAWNERKKQVFKVTHIQMAWRHLTGVK